MPCLSGQLELYSRLMPLTASLQLEIRQKERVSFIYTLHGPLRLNSVSWTQKYHPIPHWLGGYKVEHCESKYLRFHS